MKNKIVSLSFCAIAVFGILAGSSSCKKSNSSTPGNTTTASISGTAFQSQTSIGLDITAENLLTVFASQLKGSDSLVLSLQFPDTVTLNKAYPLGGSVSGASLNYTNNTTGDWFSTSQVTSSGTLTVTSLNKSSHNVQGAFSAIIWKAGGDSVIVTNGKFNANYVAQ